MTATTGSTSESLGTATKHLRTPVRWLVNSLKFASVVVLMSCGGGSTPPAAPAPAPATFASAVIGPAGGTVNGPDGVQVVIPAGALNADTTIGIARSSAGAPPTPEAYPVAGNVYELTPHGLTFNSLVTVRAPMPAGASTPLVFMASTGEGWKLVDALVVNGVAEWQRNSFSNLMMGATCSVPVAMNNDPYWCVWAGSYARVTATPAAAMVQTGSADTIRGDIGSRRMDQAATLQFKTNFSVPGNCGNVTANLRRFTYVGSATRTWSLPIIIQTKVPALTVNGGALVGTEIFDFPFDHTLPAQNRFAVVINFDCPGVAHSSTNGAVTGWDYSNHHSDSVGDGMLVTSNVPVPKAFFNVGGAVNGLSGAGLVLQNNGGNFTPVTASGGFTFSNTVGAGAPYNVTVNTQPAGQTCTVTNGSGTANANVTNVAVNCVNTFTVGGNVSGLAGTGLVLQNNGADNLAFSVSGAFSFATKLPANTNYAVTVLTQPSGSTCSVANATGTVTNANISNVAVTCLSAGPLALVANSGAPLSVGSTNAPTGLSVYRANSSTGVLSFLGNVGTGKSPYAVVLSPNGLNAYVSNQLGDSVSAYSIDNTTGVLTSLGGRVSNNASGLAMDRLGRYIWVANYGWNTVQTLTIGAGGALVSAGTPLATNASLPYVITAHPTMDFVYVAHQSSNFAVTAYSVNPADGALTLQQTLTNVIVSASGIVIEPSGRFAYVVSGSGGTCALRINASTGLLTTAGCANFSGGGGTFAVAAHPNGQYVYVTGDGTSNNVGVFAINQTTGALTQVGLPYSADNSPRGVTVNAAGTFLYVTNYVGNSVSTFAIGGGGSTLTLLAATASTGPTPQGIAVTP
jgi:6-phosphogluconolactonase (cycloisomerase 2 family)